MHETYQTCSTVSPQRANKISSQFNYIWPLWRIISQDCTLLIPHQVDLTKPLSNFSAPLNQSTNEITLPWVWNKFTKFGVGPTTFEPPMNKFSEDQQEATNLDRLSVHLSWLWYVFYALSCFHTVYTEFFFFASPHSRRHPNHRGNWDQRSTSSVGLVDRVGLPSYLHVEGLAQ